jgi:hypothetical protein
MDVFVPIVLLVVSTLAFAGGVFIVFRMTFGLTRGEKERQRLIAMGTPAQGRVLQVSAGNLNVTAGGHRYVQIEVSVEVHGPGAQPYPARLKTLISELQIPQVQPGMWLGIRIDPADPQIIAIELLAIPPPDDAKIRPGQAMRRAHDAREAEGTPMTGFRLPKHLIIGAVIGIVAGLTGIGAGVYSSFATVEVSGDPCKKAVACCRKSGKAGRVCDSYLRMSGEECKTALEGYPRCLGI